MEVIRNVTGQRNFTKHSAGSVLYRCGDTVVLCTASIEPNVPPWLAGKGKGWITAEYNMLPSSTSPRKARERSGEGDGGTTEIQRLIGRSFRAVADLERLGERGMAIGCEGLQGDGGTSRAGITGGRLELGFQSQSKKGDPGGRRRGRRGDQNEAVRPRQRTRARRVPPPTSCLPVSKVAAIDRFLVAA